MRKLIEQCKEHNYVYLYEDFVAIHLPLTKSVRKEVFACVECGSGLDVYDLDNPTEVKS
jgi:hypothetical protein